MTNEIIPDDRETGHNLIKSFLDGQDSFEMEKRHIQKSGNVFWTSMKVSLIRDEQNGDVELNCRKNNFFENK